MEFICTTRLRKKEEAEDIDDSIWELKCPESIDCVFILAKSKEITCLKLLTLDPNNKRLFLEIDSEPEVIPITLMLIGLQTVVTGNNCYYVVKAEGHTEITSELSTMELNLEESKGEICGTKLFELANAQGASITVQHKFGTKYWIRTEPCNKKQTSKIIILQQEDTKDIYFFFTGNSWKFKRIPFTLKPCSEYRCVTYYGTNFHTEDLPLSFKCKSTAQADFSKNYQLYWTSKSHSFMAYMTISNLKKLMEMGTKFVNRSPNQMATITFFYRNKPTEYFENIIYHNNDIMTEYMKDNNGDRFSVINKNLRGLFFSALLEPKTLKPPPTSVFGPQRMFVYSRLMLNSDSNMYFADFYCNFYVHYVTLVITIPGSEADHFCKNRLVKVNHYNNPFIKLVLEHGEFRVYVTTNVHIELFYTEDVDLHSVKYQQGGFLFEEVPVRGKGTSCPEGIAKKAGCKICNLP